MGDIKLFKTYGDRPVQLDGTSVALEKSLQELIERHLESFSGCDSCDRVLDGHDAPRPLCVRHVPEERKGTANPR